ncbi:hypothetical protein AQJ66_05220 [Streptomyces bungoensis]|uniref:DUF4232 domain-containing protein n=1 Tax=Streptomyces bungoensis TaxID=285568 RepID=A0A124I555_9ACTN|nr:DUF4232 domain-containing protein [Streptomyces bungoensis]KUN88875.1 hypothetical protein AQJ66_05220 [Streptomyces bungoensis]
MSTRTTAVAAAGLAVVLAAVGCGRDGAAAAPARARPAACRTAQLSWRLTRLPGRPHHPAATLGATLRGARRCAFDGYPELDVYVGKGPDVPARPERGAGPVRVELHPGHTLEFPVFYAASPLPDGSCRLPADTTPSVSVRPPHAHDGSLLRLSDARGHAERMQVCGTGMLLGSPRLR